MGAGIATASAAFLFAAGWAMASGPGCSPGWLAPDPAFQTNFNGAVQAMTVWDPDGPGPGAPALIAGGQFRSAGGTSAPHIARWDGQGWHALGGGVDNIVYALASWDADGAGPGAALLVAGGWIGVAGGAPASRVASWDGQAWSPLGSGVQGVVVRTLAAYDPDGSGPAPSDLIVGGSFEFAGGVTVNNIARWDGSGWHAMAGGLTGAASMFIGANARSLAVHDPDEAGPALPALIVGGIFTHAGGVPAANIAAWDGQTWSPLGLGVTGEDFPYVYALAVGRVGGAPSPSVYAGGRFSVAGGLSAPCVAEWNGSSWLPLGLGTDLQVHALAVFDADGSGAALGELHAAGYFTMADGQPANGIARWDGSSWHAMGDGHNGSAYATVEFGPAAAPALVVGGLFTLAGGAATDNLARWGCDRGCYADCDGTGALSIADFVCFQARFVSGDPYADCNGVGGLTVADFVCFQTGFVAGCP